MTEHDELLHAYETIVRALRKNSLTSADSSNLEGTPARAVAALHDMCCPRDTLVAELTECMSKEFAVTGLPNLVIESPIQTTSMCPHHLLPIIYDVCIAVKYAADSPVLGLSKLTRIARLLASRACVQEQYTNDIVELLTKHSVGNGEQSIFSNISVSGVMAVVSGVHCCMLCRGVRSHAKTTTVASSGINELEENRVWQTLKA